MIEVLKQLVEALEFFKELSLSMKEIEIAEEVIQVGKQAIAELESQEPVAIVTGDAWRTDIRFLPEGMALPPDTKLYTHPQRTWVGLAKEDRLCAKYMQDAPDGIEAVIDYIEAKLKLGNHVAQKTD